MSVAGSTRSFLADNGDPWGQSSEPSVVGRGRGSIRTQAIPHDWDDEEDEDEDSQAVWENANTKSPMPELIISRPSTGAPVVVSPPPQAIQSPLRILKRPSSTSSSHMPPQSSSSEALSSTNCSSPLLANNNNNITSSFAEREAKYQAARNRIFGGSANAIESGNTSSMQAVPLQVPASTVVRNPRGPLPSSSSFRDSGQKGVSSRGFAVRRGGRTPRTSDNKKS